MNNESDTTNNKPLAELSSSIADIFKDLVVTSSEDPLDDDLFDGLEKEIETGLQGYIKQLRKNN